MKFAYACILLCLLWFCYQLLVNCMIYLHLCNSGLILGFRPANERLRYNVTSSLIGWAQTILQGGFTGTGLPQCL